MPQCQKTPNTQVKKTYHDDRYGFCTSLSARSVPLSPLARYLSLRSLGTYVFTYCERRENRIRIYLSERYRIGILYLSLRSLARALSLSKKKISKKSERARVRSRAHSLSICPSRSVLSFAWVIVGLFCLCIRSLLTLRY